MPALRTAQIVRAGCTVCGAEISLPNDVVALEQLRAFISEHARCVFAPRVWGECRVCGTHIASTAIGEFRGRYFANCGVCGQGREVTLVLPEHARR